VIGTGVLNMGFIPHATESVTDGERLNVVFKFVLVPTDDSKLVQSKFTAWSKVTLWCCETNC